MFPNVGLGMLFVITTAQIYTKITNAIDKAVGYFRRFLLFMLNGRLFLL